MPLYFIKLTHAADQCPSANTKVRETVIKGMPEIPRLVEKLGMKFVTGPLALVTEHESFAVVEADRVECCAGVAHQALARRAEGGFAEDASPALLRLPSEAEIPARARRFFAFMRARRRWEKISRRPTAF